MKKNLAIVIILMIGLGACDFPSNFTKGFSRSAPQKTLATVDEEKVALAEAIMWTKSPKIVFKRDIFKPLVALNPASSGADKAVIASDISALILSGTLVSEHPVAFIRNTIENKNYVVREQGSVCSFQVIKIDQKGVRLAKDGKEFYLKIPEAKK